MCTIVTDVPVKDSKKRPLLPCSMSSCMIGTFGMDPVMFFFLNKDSHESICISHQAYKIMRKNQNENIMQIHKDVSTKCYERSQNL